MRRPDGGAMTRSDLTGPAGPAPSWTDGARWELAGVADQPVAHLQVTGDREALRLGLAPYVVRLSRRQAAALRDALETLVHRC